MKTVKRMMVLMVTAISFGYAGGDITPDETKPITTQRQSQWHYMFQLYALAVWIQGDAGLGYKLDRLGYENSLSGDVDMTPKDIVENLDMGAMMHFEAHHESRWGVWLDYVFMDLGASSDVGEKILQVDKLGFYQGIFEMFATYCVAMEESYIDYFGGIRWWHNTLDLTMTKNILGQNETKSWSRTIDWYDPVIGIVWVKPIDEKWTLRLRGDIGGFGIESDYTAAVELGVLYDINENWQVDMRFKSLWVDYEEGNVGEQNRFDYKTANYGPILGMTYRF